MNRRWNLPRAAVFTALLTVLLAAACVPIPGLPNSGQGGAATSQNTGNAVVPKTGSDTVIPDVKVSDQTYDGKSVVVADVISNGPGWMVIHSQSNGVVGPVVGVTHVNSGENKDVIVKVDPAKTTGVMYAMLHEDKGKVGTYEYPGPDIPTSVNGKMLTPPFMANKQTPGLDVAPLVKATNQTVQNGKITIDEVDSPTPAWIAIHALNKDGTVGESIGYTAVKAGKNVAVTVSADPAKVTQTLFAVLHTDDGTVGAFDFPQHDAAVEVDQAMIGMAFASDGKEPQSGIKLEMNMPGMASAATAQPNQPNQPTATTGAGAGEMPGMETATTAPTQPASAMVTPEPGITPVVKVSDQTLDNGMVKVDDVVSPNPGWIVIYTTTSEGWPDQVIGYTAVQKGDNQNVMVKVDPAKAQGKLYAQLHVDSGKVGTYEFPGVDAPLMLGVQMIAGTFKVAAAVANNPEPTATTGMGDMPTPGNTETPQAPSQSTLPFIKVADQPIVNSTIVIPEVFSLGDAWLVIHRQNGDGTQGPMVGFVRVKDGDNTNVVVRVDTRFTSTTMYAMLHADMGKIGKLEFPGPDEPVMANGEMVNIPFIVTGNRDADVVINLSKDSGGVPFLVDGYDMSLYLSLKDKPGQSNCTGDCLMTFKPLIASGRVVAGSGVASNKLGILIHKDGSRQVTYAGAPLYTYVDDAKPGDINGQNLDGVWFLVNP